MSNPRNMAIALGVAGAIVFTASTSFADRAKCQAGIEKAAAAFQTKVASAVTKCIDKVAAEDVKKASAKPFDYSKVADFCNKQLFNVYSKTPTNEVTKLRAAIDKLYTTPATGPKCVAGDVVLNGHLASGPGGPAPGGTEQKFLEDYLLARGETAALRQVQGATPNMIALLEEAQTAPAGAKLAPNCTGVPNDPNLCALRVECAARGCALGGASGANLTSGIIGPVALALSGVTTIDFCVISGALSGAGLESGIVYLSGDPAQTLAPVNLGGGTFVCIDTLRGEGWCDCAGGAGIAKNTNICQDRNDNNDGAPPALDQCSQPVALATNDTNYPGTTNGLPKLSATGASVNGDCLDMLTTQFTVETGATDYGPDGIPCTADDTAAPNPPAPVPLTTGTAQAILHDAVDIFGAGDSYGVCSDAVTACVGACDNKCDATTGFCTQDGAVCSKIPCTAAGVPAPCCTGAGKGTCTAANCSTACTGTTGSDMTTGPIAGAILTPPVGLTVCQAYQQGALSGLKLVGAFPGPGKPPLGDSVTNFTLECN